MTTDSPRTKGDGPSGTSNSLSLWGNVVNLAKVVIGKEFTTSVKTSVAATISRHAIFCGGRLPPLRRVLRCAVTGRFLKLMTLPSGEGGPRSGSEEVPQRYGPRLFSCQWDKRTVPTALN